MDMKERMHTGELYLPEDDAIMAEQTRCLDRLYEYNATRPTEGKRRQALLQELFAEVGDGAILSRHFMPTGAAGMCILASMSTAISALRWWTIPTSISGMAPCLAPT